MLRPLATSLCLLVYFSTLASAEILYSAKAYEAGCQLIAQNERPADLMLAVQAGECLGAVRTLGLLNLSFEKSRRYCAPREVVLVQQIRVISKFMESHPASQSQDFVRVAMTALSEAWPCP